MKIKISWGWAFVFLIILWWVFCSSTDNSDYSRWKRSGLRIHVDALTGVNYFSTAGFLGIGQSLTVRLNTNGLPVVTQP